MKKERLFLSLTNLSVIVLGSDTRPTKRWYITLPETMMQECFRTLERKARKPDALTKLMEIIEQRIQAIEMLVVQKCQQITEALKAKTTKKAWFNPFPNNKF